jgi:hypothetical protein
MCAPLSQALPDCPLTRYTHPQQLVSRLELGQPEGRLLSGAHPLSCYFKLAARSFLGTYMGEKEG